MEEHKFESLKINSAAELEKHFVSLERKLMARETIHNEIEKMKADGKAYSLSEEEVRLLRQFRSFKATCKAGAVFTWQTRPIEVVTLHGEGSDMEASEPRHK